jgi:hypothetical protein
MLISRRFIYTQTRLQARHGMRPNKQEWRMVEGQKELASFLQSARQTSLRPWVLSMHAQDNSHLLEATLRQLYRNYVDEVVIWLPSPWRASVQWVKYLLDLPSLQYLLSGNTAPTWMRDDPQIKQFTPTYLEARIQVMQKSVYAPLIAARQSGKTLLTGWTEHWRSLWPQEKSNRSIVKLIALFNQHLANFQQLSPQLAWKSRETLATKLTIMFRQFSYQPVAAFIHLALIALDLERLRGDVIQRCLFPGFKELAL